MEKKYIVSTNMFEDEGAHWIKLRECREQPADPNALPFVGQSLSFCGNTPAEALQRAQAFIRSAAKLLGVSCA